MGGHNQPCSPRVTTDPDPVYPASDGPGNSLPGIRTRFSFFTTIAHTDADRDADSQPLPNGNYDSDADCHGYSDPLAYPDLHPNRSHYALKAADQRL